MIYKALTKEMESKEPVYKEVFSAFDELKKTADKIENVRDLPEKTAQVEQYKHRWSSLKKTVKDQSLEIQQYVDLHKKYDDLREKLHNGVPKQIDDSLNEILFIGANTKSTGKQVKRVEVRVLLLVV